MAFNVLIISRALRTLWTDGFYRTFLFTIRFISWKIDYHRRVGQLPSRVARIFFYITKKWVHLINKIGRLLNENEYTDADPYKTIYVNPNEIQLETSTAARRRGWVEDGTWDEEGDTFMNRTYPRAIEQRYRENIPWKKTVLVSKYDDEEEFEQRCIEIEQLYNSIQNQGYRSQKQLLEDSPEFAWNGLNDVMHPSVNEIAVDIGRNGELLWNMCGQHRLAVAKVLEIDKICVQVLRRHKQWQFIRNQIRKGHSIPEDITNHPDIQDIKWKNI